MRKCIITTTEEKNGKEFMYTHSVLLKPEHQDKKCVLVYENGEFYFQPLASCESCSERIEDNGLTIDPVVEAPEVPVSPEVPEEPVSPEMPEEPVVSEAPVVEKKSKKNK